MTSRSEKVHRGGGRLATAAWAIAVVCVELLWVALLVYGIVWVVRR